ncbi:MAG: hypothetical protein JWQ88_3344 [Rhodoferax sp.]|nr:hypothetical protein [Rhodoferax sp.]
MMLLLLEALGAGLVLVLIVWWTMFSGRKGGELPDAQPGSPGDDTPAGANPASDSAERPDRTDRNDHSPGR